MPQNLIFQTIRRIPIINSLSYTLLIWVAEIYKILAYTLYIFFPTTIYNQVYVFFDEKGIGFNGKKTSDIQIYNNKFWPRVGIEASLGLGESYMAGWWTCQDLVEFSFKLFREGSVKEKNPFTRKLNEVTLGELNLQTKDNSEKVAEVHYNIGNELYEEMLDKYMQYTCGYWKDAKTLGEAQIAKMELIAQKLKIKPGQRVLDLGCGFGGLSKYLAENYQVEVVGLNISKEQIKFAKKMCKDLTNIKFLLCDYRELNDHVTEKFDRVVSVGLLEHIGQFNYREFFELVNRNLTDDGICLIHTIGVCHKEMILTDRFVHEYIFPNGRLPFITDVPKYTEELFIVEDFQNFGNDYYHTLLAWHENFIKAWPKLKNLGQYDEKFFRMWQYYLLMSAGCFKARKFQLFQYVLSKNGLIDGYRSVR